ncbi:MAG: DUF3179 domain-containing protein [Acidobacteriota bacterium]
MIRSTAATLATTLLLTLGAGGSPAAGQAAAAQADAEGAIDPGYLQIRDLMNQSRKTRRTASKALVDRGDPSLAFGIVDTLFFIPVRLREEAIETLEALTGEKPGRSYWNWVEAVGRLGETLRPAPGYEQWKAILLSQIDEEYRKILYANVPAEIRLEEVVTGGVRVEGIPALDDPTMVPADEVRYLKDDEEIFGIEIDGDARAYPLRILDWHEMLNDTVAGQPVTLSYCTLCGSGVLYSTRLPDGRTFRFGTSGLLYRSNKLMLERESRSLWSNLTGEPVVGPQVGSGLQLEYVPHTRTTWADWKRRHPETLVVKIDRDLKEVARKHGFDYRPGEADERRRNVSFPVWKKNDVLPREEEVYALRLDGAAKAYPLETLLKTGIVNDTVGDRPVVLVADDGTGAVRAYERGNLEFQGDGEVLVGTGGVRYRVEEGRLAPVDAEAGEPLRRLPGHFAFWFGWYAFFPRTEVWEGPIVGAGAG